MGGGSLIPPRGESGADSAQRPGHGVLGVPRRDPVWRSGFAVWLADRDDAGGYLLSAFVAMSAVAVSMIVCSMVRGCQPSWVRALLLSTSLLRPSSGRNIAICGF